LGAAGTRPKISRILPLTRDTTMDPSSLNPIAIAVAAALSFLIGGVWYSPVLFARRWQAAAGLTDEQLKNAGMAKIFGLAFLASLVMAANLAAFLGPKATVGFGLAAGAATGIGWVAMCFAINDLFERRPLALWLINSGYHVIALTVMGGVLAWWK
jgi:small basic protein